MSTAAVRAGCRVDVAKIPAYAGAEMQGGGFALYRIGAVKKYAAPGSEPPVARALRQNYEQTVAEQELMAWIETLKARHEVTINQKLLESKER